MFKRSQCSVTGMEGGWPEMGDASVDYDSSAFFHIVPAFRLNRWNLHSLYGTRYSSPNDHPCAISQASFGPLQLLTSLCHEVSGRGSEKRGASFFSFFFFFFKVYLFLGQRETA